MSEKHEVEWTPEKVSRIWEHISKRASDSPSARYFSDIFGDDIICQVNRRARIKGDILDFGCGGGHLIEKLLKRGARCEGVDFSKESVERLMARKDSLPNKDLFIGATAIDSIPSPDLRPDAYDMVFLIETIEHLFPSEIDSTLTEINRVLKKGGTIVVTTPNKENLNDSKEMCPDCGCVFHRVQHMRSWTPEELADVMDKAGFTKVFSTAVLFFNVPIATPILRIGIKLTGRKLPHLLYIGKKR